MKTELTLLEWQEASVAQRHEWLCEDRRLDALSARILHQQIVWGASDAQAREVYQHALSSYREHNQDRHPNEENASCEHP